MFTADLKSFADYNLTPSPSPQKKSPTPKRKRQEELKQEDIDCLPTPPLTPGPTTLSKVVIEAAAVLTKQSSFEAETENLTLVDRVKRRRTGKRI